MDTMNLKLKVMSMTKKLDEVASSLIDKTFYKIAEMKHPSMKTLEKVNGREYWCDIKSLVSRVGCTGDVTLDEALHPDAKYRDVRMSEYRGFVLNTIPDPEKPNVLGAEGYKTENTEAMLPCIRVNGFTSGIKSREFNVTIAYQPPALVASYDMAKKGIDDMTKRIYRVLSMEATENCLGRK